MGLKLVLHRRVGHVTAGFRRTLVGLKQRPEGAGGGLVDAFQTDPCGVEADQLVEALLVELVSDGPLWG